MPRPIRLLLVHAALMLFVALLLVRSAQVQIFQRDRWASDATRQQTKTLEIPAPRGGVYDMDGTPLARNIEYVTLGISPREVRDRQRLARELRRLRLPARTIRQATNPRSKWLPVPGRFSRDTVIGLRGLKGVFITPIYERRYSSRPSTRRLVGRAAPGGSGTDGLERALDEFLTGTPGERVEVVNGLRRSRGSPEFDEVPPRPGDDVVLTISQEWQEIAERALREAVDSMSASGGDMVVLDPRTGAVRALAAVRRTRAVSGIPALTEPFEPGSTIKPLIAATLLSLGRATLDDRVDVERGRYTVAGRTISDTHTGDSLLTLADVIAHSSNVGIVKFAERLSRSEQYQALRDFGLGSPTGIAYPSEASGRLRNANAWGPQSPASVAIGYEVSVTALQLASAYAAFANGGLLLEPALVQEIRSADGAVRYRHERRVVRRVMTTDVARTVMEMLRQTAEAGTATAAAPAGYRVAGKTGTARRTVNGSYVGGGYTASFVGLFPADAPQVVVVVKLDDPRGRYYGGQTAAPVFRAAMHAALAARGGSIDRASLASSGPVEDTIADAVVVAEANVTAEVDTLPIEEPERGPVRFALPYAAPAAEEPRAPRPVPDVRGMSLREAAHALHTAGFRVRIAGSGHVVSSAPPPGTVASAGAPVRVVAEP